MLHCRTKNFNDGCNHTCIRVPCFLLSFAKVYFLSSAMYWAFSRCSDTRMHHMCIVVPCFLLSFNNVCFLSHAMYCACSKYADHGMHHMCIGVPCFYCLLLKCNFYLLPCTGPVLSVQIPEGITCVLACLVFTVSY